MPFLRRSQQPPAEEPPPCQAEAATFIEIMDDLGSGLRLDYSPTSLRSLEEFIAAQFDPPGSKFVGENLPIGVGCYVGEVVIRNLGGRWSPEGTAEVVDIGKVRRIFPVQKARKRFANGDEDNLAWYYEVIARHAREG